MNNHRTKNIDQRVVAGFGDEWSRFDQSDVSEGELARTFDEYFDIFPWESLSPLPTGFDLGCGSGRYAKFVAPRAGRLHCIDASARAIEVARHNLAEEQNCEFHVATVDEIPLVDESVDFGYSLGVLHHVPNTAEGLRACVRKLRKGAPFLVYLYYRFDDRPRWYVALWRLAEAFRFGISKLPSRLRFIASDLFALFVYWPLARLARLAERLGFAVESFPLSYYRRRSFYTMRTDSLDRFGTRLEQRFTRSEVVAMMKGAGLGEVVVGENPPFWRAVGVREW